MRVVCTERLARSRHRTWNEISLASCKGAGPQAGFASILRKVGKMNARPVSDAQDDFRKTVSKLQSNNGRQADL